MDYTIAMIGQYFTAPSGAQAYIWDKSTIAQAVVIDDPQLWEPIGLGDGRLIGLSADSFSSNAPSRHSYINEYSFVSGDKLSDKPPYGQGLPTGSTLRYAPAYRQQLAGISQDGQTVFMVATPNLSSSATLYRSTVAGYSAICALPAGYDFAATIPSHDGSMVAVVSNTGIPDSSALSVVNASTGELLPVSGWFAGCGETAPAASATITCAWSPDSSKLAVFYMSGDAGNPWRCAVINPQNGALLVGPHSSLVSTSNAQLVGWTSGGRLVVAYEGNSPPIGGNPDSGPIRLIDAASMTPVGNIDASYQTGYGDTYNVTVWPEMVCVVPGTNAVVVRSYQATEAKVWDAASGGLLYTLTGAPSVSESNFIIMASPYASPALPFWTNLVGSVEYP